jgi:hypothetical protein
VTAAVAVRFGRPGPAVARPLSRDFPTVARVDRLEPCSDTVAVDLQAWRDGRVDFYWVDAQADALAERGLVPVEAAGEPASRLELVTRCQRWVGRRNRHSQQAWFDDLLRFHRSLHDREKPLVRADHNHALDVWQWLLRLAPEASAAAQVAALFHGVERLRRGPDSRLEHLAEEYGSFTPRCAEAGGRILAEVLSGSPVPAPVSRRAAQLLAAGDQRVDLLADGDGEAELLEDADCLSFFSLNSPGFLDYHGSSHTTRKISWTMRRLSLRACSFLPSIRLRPDVAELMSFAVAA